MAHSLQEKVAKDELLVVAVSGFEGAYEAYSDGRIFSVRRKDGLGRLRGGKFLSQTKDPDGYLGVNLSLLGKVTYRKVHRIVLESFVGPRPDGFECRHLDGNRENNRTSNLSWGTHRENEDDRVRHGSVAHGFQHPSTRVSDSAIACIRSAFGKQRDVAKRFGVSQYTVWAIQSGLRWTGAGSIGAWDFCESGGI